MSAVKPYSARLVSKYLPVPGAVMVGAARSFAGSPSARRSSRGMPARGESCEHSFLRSCGDADHPRCLRVRAEACSLRGRRCRAAKTTRHIVVVMGVFRGDHERIVQGRIRRRRAGRTNSTLHECDTCRHARTPYSQPASALSTRITAPPPEPTILTPGATPAYVPPERVPNPPMMPAQCVPWPTLSVSELLDRERGQEAATGHAADVNAGVSVCSIETSAACSV